MRFTEMLKQRKRDSLKLTDSLSPRRFTQKKSEYDSPYSQKNLTRSSKVIKPFKNNIPKQDVLMEDLLKHNNRGEYKTEENYDFTAALRKKEVNNRFTETFEKSIKEKGQSPQQIRQKTLAQKQMDAEIEKLRQQKSAEEEYQRMRALKQNESPKRKKKSQKNDKRGEPDMILKINVPGKGEQPLNYYEGEDVEDLARDFCIQHLITDPKKQDKLLRILEHKIEQNQLKKQNLLQSEFANTSKAYSLGSQAFMTGAQNDPEFY